MKKHILTNATFMFVLSQATFATASDFKFSGNATVISDYTFRGLSQSDENPTLQAGLGVEHSSGFSAAVWASGVDYNDDTPTVDGADFELVWHGDYKYEFGNSYIGTGFSYYTFPGASSSLNYDYLDLHLKAGHSFEKFNVSAQFSWSPEYYADSGEGYYITVGANAPITEKLKFNTHIGHQWIEDNTSFGVPDYLEWSAGISYAVSPHVSLTFDYIDTDINKTDCSNGCDSRGIAGLTVHF